jgi:hypothetical protein
LGGVVKNLEDGSVYVFGSVLIGICAILVVVVVNFAPLLR